MSRTSSTLSRRRLLQLGAGSLGGVAVGGLAGCSNPLTNQGNSGSGVSGSIRMTWWGDNTVIPRYLAALEVLKAKYPQLVIAPEYTAQGGSPYNDKVTTQMVGGGAPDIIQSRNETIPDWGLRGALLDQSGFIESQAINLAAWNEEVRNFGVLDGKRFGTALSVTTFAVAYDATVMGELGITVPEAWTSENFAEIATEVSRARGGDYYGTGDGGGLDRLFNVFLRQRGKAQYTAEGQLGFDREDLVEYWGYWDELRKDGAAPPAAVTAANAPTGGPPEMNPLSVGITAMYPFTFANQYGAYVEASENEIKITRLPEGPAGSDQGFYIEPGLLLSASSKTSNEDAVAAVINGFVNDPEVHKPIGLALGLPPAPGNQEQALEGADDVGLTTAEYIRAAIADAPPSPPIFPRGSVQLRSDFASIHEKVAFGQVSIGDGVDDWLAQGQRLLG